MFWAFIIFLGTVTAAFGVFMLYFQDKTDSENDQSELLTLLKDATDERDSLQILIKYQNISLEDRLRKDYPFGWVFFSVDGREKLVISPDANIKADIEYLQAKFENGQIIQRPSFNIKNLIVYESQAYMSGNSYMSGNAHMFSNIKIEIPASELSNKFQAFYLSEKFAVSFEILKTLGFDTYIVGVHPPKYN